jgi:hypothetical protein
MRPVRAHLRLRSRRANLSPKTAPLIVTKHGKEETVDVSIKEHPLLLTFPVFAPPSIVTGQRVKGINVRGQFTFQFGKPYKDVVRDMQADNVRYSADYKPVQFAQMIGKIAWSMCAANGDLRSVRPDRSVVSALIGDPNEIGQWVGTFTDSAPDQTVPGRLHSMVIRADTARGLLVAEVQLFADSGAPRYAVVLGRLRRWVLCKERVKRWGADMWHRFQSK